MSDPDAESDEPTQSTPAGATIPVPERDDVMEALRKVAFAEPPHSPESDEDAPAE